MNKFEDWWNIHNCVKESLMREDARYVYESHQDEVYKLQSEIDGLQKRVDELSKINESLTDELVAYRSRFGNKGNRHEH